MRIAILYASREGHTAAIAAVIERALAQHHHCALYDITQLPRSFSLDAVDAIVIGSAVHYGHIAKAVRQFAKQYAPQLNAMPSAFFSVSLIARKASKNTPEGNVYTRKFLAGSAWQPQTCGVFAGAVSYDRYPLWDRIMVRLIMAMGKGETGRHAHVDYTDWEAVTRFAAHLDAEWCSASRD